ncbi:hypothetical protein [Nocardia sp. NPDC059228]|uniref:hypothetical protein n=1 Tax=Nocardia sp. NPDC059228 TaxID=3346777 RepID=UPI0036778404
MTDDRYDPKDRYGLFGGSFPLSALQDLVQQLDALDDMPPETAGERNERERQERERQERERRTERARQAHEREHGRTR